MQAPRHPPLERALTAEEVTSLKRDLQAVARSDFRAKVYAAIHLANRLADNMVSSVGQLTADQAFVGWQRHLVKQWGEAIPVPDAPGLVLEPLTGDWAYLDGHGGLWRLHATGDAEMPFTIERVSEQA